MNVEDKIRHSEELIKRMRQEKPFQHADIKKFYKRHQGNDRNSFIQARFWLLDYHIAIYSLLLFLDRYGDERIPIGETGHHTTLREHSLAVTEVTLRSLRTTYPLPHDTNLKLIWGGMAALSCSLGSGLGAKYCEPFKDLGQASIALLEQMPEINSLYFFTGLKEVIRLYSIYVKTSITHAKNHLEKDNMVSDLAKVLVAAELQVKRREIFRYAEKPQGFQLAGKEIQAKRDEAAEIVRQAEIERQQLKIDLEEEFGRKKEAYVSELSGLRTSRDRCTAENKIKDKIIRALKKNDKEAVKLAEEELKDLKKNISAKDKENSTEEK